ncbi:hypothetical protein K1719_047581, partial [Acacia pycnantha]
KTILREWVGGCCNLSFGHFLLLEASSSLMPWPLTPKRFISTDGVLNARARALGGGSVINAGFYSRAEPEFCEGSRLGREAGEGVVVRGEWVEKVVAFEPTVRQWQSAVRDGLKEVGVLPYNWL